MIGAQSWGREPAELRRARLLAAIDRTTVDLINEARAARRRDLYAEDPLWRLSKLKDNRERRQRAKLQQELDRQLATERHAWRLAQAARRRQRGPYRARSPLIGATAPAAAAGFPRATESYPQANRRNDCRATESPLAIVSSLSDSTESANHCRRLFRNGARELADLTQRGETNLMHATFETTSVEGAPQ